LGNEVGHYPFRDKLHEQLMEKLIDRKDVARAGKKKAKYLNIIDNLIAASEDFPTFNHWQTVVISRAFHLEVE
jgi:hypothetical protein